jgi:D-alanine transaminase
LEQIAYVNGSFVPLSEAKVSIFDRGFLFADGIYEVAAVLDGKLIDNASHLARLERSVGEIELALPETTARIQEIQQELVKRNDLVNGMVYLEVTRGADTGRDFAFPKGVKPTLVMFTSTKDIINAPSAKTGINVITVPDLRWTRRDIKSVALLAQVLAKQAAAAAGAGEAWMIEDGKVTEGGSSSCFILTQDDVIVTRQNGSEILPGCTRKAVVALAEERQLRVGRGSAGRQGGLHHQRHGVRAGGGVDRRQEGRRWQARADDQPAARDLRGFRQGDRGMTRQFSFRHAGLARQSIKKCLLRRLMDSRLPTPPLPLPSPDESRGTRSRSCSRH